MTAFKARQEEYAKAFDFQDFKLFYLKKADESVGRISQKQQLLTIAMTMAKCWSKRTFNFRLNVIYL